MFQVWRHGGGCHSVFEGEGPPHFADGTPFHEANELVATFPVESWLEAMKLYHELMGYGPYVPTDWPP
jgi:hypothetical protein